ncbi:MAG: hypothetical protein FJZ05_02660 [Candidatus Nealsonbacteria bacterium]|nr:hypothetical protein [Candidatus Nealsonbacteria bacterium]
MQINIPAKNCTIFPVAAVIVLLWWKRTGEKTGFAVKKKRKNKDSSNPNSVLEKYLGNKNKKEL